MEHAHKQLDEERKSILNLDMRPFYNAYSKIVAKVVFFFINEIIFLKNIRQNAYNPNRCNNYSNGIKPMNKIPMIIFHPYRAQMMVKFLWDSIS